MGAGVCARPLPLLSRSQVNSNTDGQLGGCNVFLGFCKNNISRTLVLTTGPCRVTCRRRGVFTDAEEPARDKSGSKQKAVLRPVAAAAARGRPPPSHVSIRSGCRKYRLSFSPYRNAASVVSASFFMTALGRRLHRARCSSSLARSRGRSPSRPRAEPREDVRRATRSVSECSPVRRRGLREVCRVSRISFLQMVVLEDGGMMTSNPNQYLPPDYLSPLPSSLDSKKSPLALLAQTCSQIGADTLPTKPLLPPLDKKKTVNSVNSESVSRCSPNNNNVSKPDKPRSTPETKHLAFKPYETNVVSKKSDDNTRPSSKASSDSSDEKKSGKSTPGRKSTPLNTIENGKNSPSEQKSPAGSSGTSPIIRSGLEVLGHGKDHLGAFKNLPGLPGFNPLTGLCCPPGMEQHGNPAFRPPYAGAPFSAHHAAMLAAAAAFPGSSPNPYLGYARVKTPAGGETLVPVCKDPYCTGCQFSVNNHHLMMSNGTCPAGCTQCEHQKYNLAMAMVLSQQGAAAAASALPYSQLSRPYVCNWIVGESYCGKRFSNSEELLQHLRSHTSDGSTPVTASASQPPLLNPLNPLFTTAGLRGAYPAAPLSPLSATRYHPYSKAGLPAGLTASPYGAFNPALGPFYSPYAMYGQRIGAAAVHQ
ncbi:Zinc finger protein Noc [Eumeta japonica]|uniref:Zinc finger protein Noc n=1 Tax=Eumeta variegata TaxID=151549 RepID=A0A4C1VDX7_EUMVA|nr:Zinc finger protein Noc [Eumeta japonica]